jgi:uncharacterized protein
MPFPKDPSLIHMFKVKGRRFVYDVNSCFFTEIDALAWNVLKQSAHAHTKSDIEHALTSKYNKTDIAVAIDELELLQAKGRLFSQDQTTNAKGGSSHVISSLCLMVAQDCDLSCRYCFAQTGTYGKQKTKMSREVAYKTVDFLIANSYELPKVTLCFFGGEPLLNFPVIQDTVEYALARSKETGKQFLFNLTTNGTMLTKPKTEFLASNNFGVIFSIDGPKDVQDDMRPFRDGSGSYTVVSHNLKSLVQNSSGPRLNFSVRGTYTRKHHNLSKVVAHLLELGCREISVEPAILEHEQLQIRRKDLPRIKRDYAKLADFYIAKINEGIAFSFFHFRLVMDQAYRPTRNYTQCHAATGYLAVSANGDLYPCHRLVGKENFQMGNVFKGISQPEIQEIFDSAQVNNKSKCHRCWAKYTCGGGCNAYSIEFNNNIHKPYEIECELMKCRIELGAYIYAYIAENYAQITSRLANLSARSRPYLNQKTES